MRLLLLLLLLLLVVVVVVMAAAIAAADVEGGKVIDLGLDCPLAWRDSMGEKEEEAEAEEEEELAKAAAVGGGRLETAVLRRELMYRPGKGKIRRPVTY